MINDLGVFLMSLVGTLIIVLVTMDILQVRRDRKRRERQREQGIDQQKHGHIRLPILAREGNYIGGINFADFGTHMITRDPSRREVVSAIRGGQGWRVHCNSCGRGWTIYDTDRDRARRACLDHTRTCLERATNMEKEAAATP